MAFESESNLSRQILCEMSLAQHSGHYEPIMVDNSSQLFVYKPNTPYKMHIQLLLLCIQPTVRPQLRPRCWWWSVSALAIFHGYLSFLSKKRKSVNVLLLLRLAWRRPWFVINNKRRPHADSTHDGKKKEKLSTLDTHTYKKSFAVIIFILFSLGTLAGHKVIVSPLYVSLWVIKDGFESSEK